MNKIRGFVTSPLGITTIATLVVLGYLLVAVNMLAALVPLLVGIVIAALESQSSGRPMPLERALFFVCFAGVVLAIAQWMPFFQG